MLDIKNMYAPGYLQAGTQHQNASLEGPEATKTYKYCITWHFKLRPLWLCLRLAACALLLGQSCQHCTLDHVEEVALHIDACTTWVPTLDK